MKEKNLTLDQAGIALSFCNPDDRETWVSMGMALKSEFGDDAFQHWDNWSSQSSSYKPRDAKSVWKSIKPHGRIKIGTLIKEAQNNGFKFEAEKNIISDEELERRRIAREKRDKESKEETERLQAQAKEHAQKLWESSTPATNDHPYLKRKGVSVKGIRVGTWKAIAGDGREWLSVPNALLVPLKNESRELVSLQAIFDKEHPKLGRDKDFITGGQKSGCFFGFGSLPKDGSRTRIVIGEGYATMATIHDATGYICIVAFDAGNLTPVSNIIRKQNPDAEILIAADNDRRKPKNTGVESAKRAALESNAKLAIPMFNSDDLSLTDFNDLAKAEGLESVKNAINSAFNYGSDIDNDIAINDMPDYDFVGFDMIESVELDENEVKPSQKQSVNHEPFKILGYYEDKIFILPRESNQIRTISYGSMTENTLISIAPLEWWESRFVKKTGFDLKAAVDTIFRKAHRQGIFLTDRLRGRGCWRDSNRVVFHLGNRLLVNGEYFDLSDFDSRYIYQQDKPFPKFDHMPVLTKEEGADILMLANKFRWSIPASSLLLTGWCVLAPICGALKWRPHIWLTGGAGSGKSTIIDEFVNSLMGGVAVFAQGNSSEAGLRQHLKSDAVPVIFDEAEQNTEKEQKSMQAVLALIRQSSSESGAKTLKGTATGVGMTYHIRSMFCLASIQVGIQQQADRERLTVLQLREKEDVKQGENNWDEIKDTLYKLKRDSDTSLRLLNRTVSMLPMIIQSIKVFVDVAAQHFGNQRTGDQYGTLLAGTWSLVNDQPPTKEQAKALIDASDWTDYTSTKKGNDSVIALDALLSAKLKSYSGAEFTIFELLDAIAADKGLPRSSDVAPALNLKTNDANDVFQRYGMKYDHAEKALLISNNSDGIETLMKNTKYAADIRGALLRNKSARKITSPKRFAGGMARCIGIGILDIV